MEHYECTTCGDTDLSVDEVESGVCLLCRNKTLNKSKVRKVFECIRCNKMIQIKFIEDGVCLKCKNSDLLKNIRDNLRDANELEEEAKKNDFLKQMEKLAKQKYLRSDMDLSNVRSLPNLLQDSNLRVSHPESAIAKAVSIWSYNKHYNTSGKTISR